LAPTELGTRYAATRLLPAFGPCFALVQGTASEATFVALLAARSKAVAAAEKYDQACDLQILSKLVAYCSDQVTQV